MKNVINKFLKKIKSLFNQGLTPLQLALSLVLSIAISLFPVIGLTTLVVTFVAAYFKLNFPIMIALAYVMEPIKLFLIVPFIKLGAKIFEVEHSLLSYEAIVKSFKTNILSTFEELGYELICGFMGWFVTVIPIGVVLFFSLKLIFSHFQNTDNERFSIQ